MTTTLADEFNAINVRWDHRKATITVQLAGKSIAWIDYDLMQLENLIALLQEARDGIAGEFPR